MTVLVLASDAASWMTGSFINVDGGFIAKEIAAGLCIRNSCRLRPVNICVRKLVRDVNMIIDGYQVDERETGPKLWRANVCKIPQLSRW
jgi:hypothetical protein